ncbi:hypothetical protein CF327_g7075 [Tilletia walkeri]|nr:hypothetical protein CF327_g7075 [Tilletia walkeri]
MLVTNRRRKSAGGSILLIIFVVGIVQLTLSSRSPSSAISIQKNNKVKACQPIPINKSPSAICKHVHKHCTLDGHINYLASYYCASTPPTRAAILTSIAAWLLFLFSAVGLVASDFFSPNLSTLASRLHLSESTAGVSLLAFGNGSPDVFSTFAAMRSGSGSLAIGELIGAASFITAVVAAAMMLIQPFKVKPYPFLRDVGFFTVAIALALFVLLDGTLHLTESVALVMLYVMYAAIVIVGSWWQERRRQQKISQRAETRPSVIEAGFIPSSSSTTQDNLINVDDDEEEDGTPTPVQTSFPPTTTTTNATPHHTPSKTPSSKTPNLKLQIPQTPLQHKPSLPRFLAPPQTGASSIHSGSNASSPPTSPVHSHQAGKSPSALVRSEYEPDADDEDGGGLSTASIGYATEMDPFDRLAQFPRTSISGPSGGSAAENSPTSTQGLTGAKSAQSHPVAPSYTFPALPAQQEAVVSTSSLPPSSAPALGPKTNAPPAATHTNNNNPSSSSSPAIVRPGYYLPRHSLLGAIEFRDVVRSLQAESQAALLASPHTHALHSPARTPGDYYADEDSEDEEGSGGAADDAFLGGAKGRRTSSVFKPFSMARTASSEGDLEGSSRNGSVSRKANQQNRGLLSSLGFGGTHSRGNSETDDAAVGDGTRLRHHHHHPRGGHVRGSSLSVDPSFSAAAAAGKNARPMSAHPISSARQSDSIGRHQGHRHHHLRTKSTSVGSGLIAATSAATAVGMGRSTSSSGEGGLPNHEPLLLTPGQAVRDRGWELFYSRGLELESDWERLAAVSPGGVVSGSGAERNREAMRAHLLSAHQASVAGGHHHHHHNRSNSQNLRRRSTKVRPGVEGGGGGADEVLPSPHRHRRAHSTQPALGGGGGGIPSVRVPPSPDTTGLLGTENLPGIKGMGRSASAVVPEQRRVLSSGGSSGALSPRSVAVARMESTATGTGGKLAVPGPARGEVLVDVSGLEQADDRKSSRSVPSIMVDADPSSKSPSAGDGEDEDEDVNRTPRQGTGFSRTLSTSTTLTADVEEEGRGLRMRTTSGGSYAHTRMNFDDEEGRSKSWSFRNFRKRIAHGYAHFHYDFVEPVLHTLFPSLRHLGSKSWVGIVVSLLSVPAIFMLKLTLPVVVEEEDEELEAAEREAEMAKEMDKEGRHYHRRHGRRGGSGGSSPQSRRRRPGPLRLEGEEHLIVARPIIASPAALSDEALTPTLSSSDPNAHVAAGLKSLQTHPEAVFQSSQSSTTQDGLLTTPLKGENGKASLKPYKDDEEDDGSVGVGTNDDDDDDEDGSESCESCDEAEAAEEARAFLDREERKRRATASRFLALAQLSLGPTFCTWAILSPDAFSWDDPGTRMVTWVFVVGTTLALLCVLGVRLGARKVMARRPAIRSTISLVRCLGGFVVSVMFIMTIVDEVVSILQAMGIILGLSDAILGLTIFAMGNSLGDLVANITIARMGHPVMAISACFAGPLLNILLGIGLSGTYILTAPRPEGVERPILVLDFSPTLLVSCIGLLVILVGILIAVPLNGFYLDRKLGMTLIITYGVIMTTNILTEIFVDKD